MANARHHDEFDRAGTVIDEMREQMAVLLTETVRKLPPDAAALVACELSKAACQLSSALLAAFFGLSIDDEYLQREIVIDIARYIKLCASSPAGANHNPSHLRFLEKLARRRMQ